MDKIKLDLNIYQQAILRKEFKSVDGALKLNRDSKVGKYIYSHIKWVKEKPEETHEGIDVLLPDDYLVMQEYYYPSLSVFSRRNICDFLDATFSLKAELFFVRGYRHKYQQKDIVDAFIYHYGLPGTITTFEMIKQRDFRMRKGITKTIAEFASKN